MKSDQVSAVLAPLWYFRRIFYLKRRIRGSDLHRSDDEAWYVLEGTLRVQVGENEIEARTGCAILVPRGTHLLESRPRTPSLPLLMTPNIFTLIQELHALQERTPATLH